MVGDNHTWLANRSAQCVKKGGGGSIKAWPLAAVSSPLPKVERAWEGSCFRSAAQLGCRCVCVCTGPGAYMRCASIQISVCVCVCAFVDVDTYNVTTQMLYPLGSGARWIYRAALQRLALHFQTSNFSLSNVVLIKPVHQWKLPELWTKFNHKVSSDTTLSEQKS